MDEGAFFCETDYVLVLIVLWYQARDEVWKYVGLIMRVTSFII